MNVKSKHVIKNNPQSVLSDDNLYEETRKRDKLQDFTSHSKCSYYRKSRQLKVTHNSLGLPCEAIVEM